MTSKLPNEFYRACEEATYSFSAMRAPHVLLKPHFGKCGNQYSFLLGDNLAEGISGFGDTPAKAAADFDKIGLKRRFQMTDNTKTSGYRYE